ncbi:MAG: hypothetical protein ACHQ1E_05095 [Ktedonobacterales bacterium]
MSTIAEELNALLAQLPPSEQARVLNFARDLARPPFVIAHTPLPPGSSPDALLRIRVDPEVGEAMEQALADCERIDPDE